MGSSWVVGAYLNIRALELGDQDAVAREHGDVELVAVWVPNEHIAGIRHVDAVGEVGHVLAADAAQEATLVVEHYHAVPLEVAHVELLAWSSGGDDFACC